MHHMIMETLHTHSLHQVQSLLTICPHIQSAGDIRGQEERIYRRATTQGGADETDVC